MGADEKLTAFVELESAIHAGTIWFDGRNCAESVKAGNMFRALLRCSHLAQLAAASSGERSQRRAGDRKLFPATLLLRGGRGILAKAAKSGRRGDRSQRFRLDSEPNFVRNCVP